MFPSWHWAPRRLHRSWVRRWTGPWGHGAMGRRSKGIRSYECLEGWSRKHIYLRFKTLWLEYDWIMNYESNSSFHFRDPIIRQTHGMPKKSVAFTLCQKQAAMNIVLLDLVARWMLPPPWDSFDLAFLGATCHESPRWTPGENGIDLEARPIQVHPGLSNRRRQWKITHFCHVLSHQNRHICTGYLSTCLWENRDDPCLVMSFFKGSPIAGL